MGIQKNDFWDSNYYNHPDLTDAMVEIAEKELGVKLPPLLLELLKVQNGGYTKGFAYPMIKKTTWADDHVPFSELFGIVTDKSVETAQNMLDTHYMIKEWGLPEKQVLLCGDGHWWLTLDYRKESSPSVRWIDVECEEDIEVASSFEAFINGLVPDSTYAV